VWRTVEKASEILASSIPEAESEAESAEGLAESA
jgi:hypothetical protein